MKKLALYLVLILCLQNFSFAQDNEVLIYEMISNEPMKSKNLSVGLDPLIIDLFDPNISVGAGIRGYYRLLNRIAIEGGYRCAYFDRISTAGYTPVEGTDKLLFVYDSRPAQEADLLARFYLVSKTVEVMEKVDVSSERRGNVQINHVTSIPSERGQLIALRLGYMSGMYHHETDSDEGFQGYYVSDPSTPLNSYLVENSSISTNVMYKTISFGVSRTRLRNVEIDIEGYGRRKSKLYSEFYFDVLYAPVVNFDNVYIAHNYNGSNGNNFYYNYKEVDLNSASKLKTGARLGVVFHGIRTAGTYVKIETGIRPGQSSFTGQWYGQIRVGMNLNFKL